MTGMKNREESIIDAAIRVISRYGVKRTTMNDIANEAGIVRQTLYNIFNSKDEVLKATIRLISERTQAAVTTECAERQALGDKLDIIFEHMAVRPFALLNTNPDADDIISGFNDAARAELMIASERNREIIEAEFSLYQHKIIAAGLTPHQLSDLLQNTLASFKHKAKDKRHLKELLKTLKSLILTTLKVE